MYLSPEFQKDVITYGDSIEKNWRLWEPYQAQMQEYVQNMPKHIAKPLWRKVINRINEETDFFRSIYSDGSHRYLTTGQITPREELRLYIDNSMDVIISPLALLRH